MKTLLLIVVLLLAIPFARGDSETVKGAQKDFESFKAEMSAKLADVDRQIDELRKKAKANGKAAQEQSAKELDDKRAKLKAELDAMNDSGKSNWKKMKKSVSESLDSLHAKAKKALEN